MEALLPVRMTIFDLISVFMTEFCLFFFFYDIVYIVYIVRMQTPACLIKYPIGQEQGEASSGGLLLPHLFLLATSCSQMAKRTTKCESDPFSLSVQHLR